MRGPVNGVLAGPVYSLHLPDVANPPPVARRHRASEVWSRTPERLSKAKTQALPAAMARSRSFLGRARRELQNVVQLLQCYLRAVELEMRAAEEPLKGNLDVKGLRAEVLERIEVLEEREREKEGLLAGVTAVAKEHGHDARTFRTVLEG